MAERFTFPQTGDKDDAEHFGALIGQGNLSNYVETGLDLQNYNASGPDIDVTTGKAFISQTSETASSSGDTILVTNSVVQIPATSALALTDSAVNEIYVNPDFGTDDNGSVEATTTGIPAGGLKIGEVDTSADTVDDDFNREPKIIIDTITDRNGNTLYDGSEILVDRIEQGAGSTLDSDTVDGFEAVDFVAVTGDQMSGDLDLSGNSLLDSLELQLNDANGDGNTWLIRENGTSGNFTIVSSANAIVADVDHSGNLRIEGSLTEGSAL